MLVTEHCQERNILSDWVLASDIGTRFKELRALIGWSQERLAKELQRRRTQAVLWENGTAKPPKRLLQEMCDRYRWPIEMFSEGGRRPGDLLEGDLPPEIASMRPDRRTKPSYSVREETVGYEREGPGWQFGDPSTWDEEQLLSILNHHERSLRATMTALDEKGIRRLRVVALEQMIEAAKERGRPLKDFAYRILRELESGEL